MKKFFAVLAAVAVVFTACQDDEDPRIDTDPTSLEFGVDEEYQIAVVMSNTSWTVTTDASDWLTVTPTSGKGDGILSITAAANEGEARSANITLTAGTVSAVIEVNQEAFVAELSVDPTSLEFEGLSSSQTVNVTSNTSWYVSIPDGYEGTGTITDWITISPTSGEGNGTITVTTTDNFDDARSYNIILVAGDAQVSIPVSQSYASVTYGDEEYKLVQMKDGRVWFAEPLRYVPSGKTPSGDPSDGNGIWYPYTSDGTTVTAATDAESIKERGYLYDASTVFGTEVTADNYTSFEGAQGICPEGYHVPTRTEFINLVGYSNKAADESGAVVKEDAAYYDTDYNGGKITALDADGFNWSFSGYVNRTSATATGSYFKNIATESTTNVDEYIGKSTMAWLWSSTGYNVSSSGNIQLFAMMQTLNLNKYPEGRLTVAYGNYLSGYTVRCIRDE